MQQQAAESSDQPPPALQSPQPNFQNQLNTNHYLNPNQNPNPNPNQNPNPNPSGGDTSAQSYDAANYASSAMYAPVTATSAPGYPQDPNAPNLPNPFNSGVATNRFEQLLALRANSILADNKVPKQPKIPVQLVRCEVCMIECNSKEILESHKKGKKHNKNLEKLKETLAPAPASGTPVMPNNLIVGPQDNPENGKAKAKESEDIELKKKKILENGTVVDAVRTCEVCDVVCNSDFVFKTHLVGKKHKKNIEKTKAHVPPAPVTPVVPNDSIIGPQVKSKKRKAKGNETEDLESKKKKIMEAGAAVDALKTCELCNVVCNSEHIFGYHLAGKKHLAMVKKSVADPQVAITT